MKTVKIVWWVLGLYFFANGIRKDGVLMGMLNWINPLQPPA